MRRLRPEENFVYIATDRRRLKIRANHLPASYHHQNILLFIIIDIIIFFFFLFFFFVFLSKKMLFCQLALTGLHLGVPFYYFGWSPFGLIFGGKIWMRWGRSFAVYFIWNDTGAKFMGGNVIFGISICSSESGKCLVSAGLWRQWRSYLNPGLLSSLRLRENHNS